MPGKILIPFNFSDESRISLRFGIAFAKEYIFEIVLFHSYELPNFSSESTFIEYPLDEILNENKNALKKEAEKINKVAKRKLITICEVMIGSVVENIIRISEQLKVNFIVMGVTHKEKIGKAIFGSSAVFVARQSSIPTFIITERINFKKISKITFAIDIYNEINQKIINQLKYLMNLFNSKLYLINFFENENETEVDRTIGELNIENNFSHLEHKTFFINKNPKKGISNLGYDSKTDLIIISPKEHSFVNDIFNEGTTKSLAYSSSIPILCLK